MEQKYFGGFDQKHDLIQQPLTMSYLFWKAALTGGDRAHHHSAEFDDGAEDVFGLGGACQILTVAF